MVFWEPERCRLTDAGCVYGILTLTPAQRAELFPYDFDIRGDPRRSCTPKPPTVVATQNNVHFYLVFKDIYLFTGGINGGEWLLKDSKDADKS